MFNIINIPLIIILVESYKYRCVVLLLSLILNSFLIFLFISFLIQWLFRSTLYSFQIFGNFPRNFLFWFVIFLCSGQRTYILCMIWVLLNLLTLVLWPRIWPILVMILYALENNMCFDVLGRVFSKCQSSKVGG